uniref:Hypothetical chloroplast RF1 n=2 Tax=Ignatiaceae TaxID=2682551 RepID=A0A1W6EGU8_9CHLO|nr:hypothetical chloroplast RF1 [Pseudocharacium americanum]YP_009367670.1 hypothetical chloroplast RF1 [Ignatius tetrasporus]ARK14618.1 hypothetical chloroplast RF1 [Pseudocharacium americanum]ARK14707.1 hypothetical chloroplast RF1 [Ignatius tetrasporus]
MNQFYESVSTGFTIQTCVYETLLYILNSLKFVFFYILSFQWLRDFSYLPILIPKINHAILSENYAFDFLLENYDASLFSFLQTAFYTNNKFFIGLLNSFFLCLPISTTQIIYLRRLLIQGYPAGIMAGLGIILGQCAFIASVIFGARFLIVPWLSLEPLQYILGLVLILSTVYDIVHNKKETRQIRVSEKRLLLKYFLINFCLTWTEQTSFMQFFGNLTFGPNPTIFEVSTALNTWSYYWTHFNYLFGILLGSFIFISFFGFLFIQLMKLIYQKFFLFFEDKFQHRVNYCLIALMLAFSMSSIPYYGLDYLVSGPLGFVYQDKALQKINLRTDLPDIGAHFTRLSSTPPPPLRIDLSIFNQESYPKKNRGIDNLPNFITDEDLNFDGEFFINSEDFLPEKTSSKDMTERITNNLNLDKKKSLAKTQLSPIDQSSISSSESNNQLGDLGDLASLDRSDSVGREKQVSDDLSSNQFEQRRRQLKTDSELKDSWVEKHLNERFFKNYDYSNSIYSDSSNDLTSQSSKKSLIKQPLDSPVDTNFFLKFETISFQNSFNQQIYDFNVRKFLKDKFYSNPVYKTLLNLDIDLFLSRQPVFQFLSPEEEKTLFNYRLILTKYYDSLREYQKISYNEEFQDLFNGSKSYINRVYNQQFKGTLNILRRLFYVSLDELSSDNLLNDKAKNLQTPASIKNSIILKYDQPLFKEFNYENNLYIHEELLNNNRKMTLTNRPLKLMSEAHSETSERSELKTNSTNQNQLNEAHSNLVSKELTKGQQSKYIQETNPYPFYVGWDEQKRKLLVTNRYFPKQIAGMQINRENLNIPQINKNLGDEASMNKSVDEKTIASNKILFSAWPVEINTQLAQAGQSEKRVLNNELMNPFKKWYLKNILQDEPKLPYISLNQATKLQKSPNFMNLNQILKNNYVLKDPSDEFTLNKLPTNTLKDVDSDEILVDILPPKTGGFIWLNKKI